MFKSTLGYATLRFPCLLKISFLIIIRASCHNYLRKQLILTSCIFLRGGRWSRWEKGVRCVHKCSIRRYGTASISRFVLYGSVIRWVCVLVLVAATSCSEQS